MKSDIPPLPAGGDGTILLAAFFYSLFTVRLSSLAARHSPIDLAAAKCGVLAAFALGARLGC